MAKTQTYSEDLLTLAVEEYAKVCSGKIIMTKLAEWSRENVDGLENVQDIHFKRVSIIKNPKTGKLEKIKRTCTLRIEEINKQRLLGDSKGYNVLLNSTDIDDFTRISPKDQRETILDVRNKIEELNKENRRLAAINVRNRRIVNDIDKKYKGLEKELKKIIKEKDDLKSLTSKTIKAVNMYQAQKALESIGIYPNGFDLKIYEENLSKDIDHFIDAYKDAETVMDHSKEPNIINKQPKTAEDVCSDIMSGLNFNTEDNDNE